MHCPPTDYDVDPLQYCTIPSQQPHLRDRNARQLGLSRGQPDSNRARGAARQCRFSVGPCLFGRHHDGSRNDAEGVMMLEASNFLEEGHTVSPLVPYQSKPLTTPKDSAMSKMRSFTCRTPLRLVLTVLAGACSPSHDDRSRVCDRCGTHARFESGTRV